MLRAGRRTRFTPEEYLALEEVTDEKNEYFDGVIYAMVGGTVDHGVISLNIGSELRTRLRDTPCTVIPGDVKLHVKANGLYTYPDVMVVCGKIETLGRRKDVVVNPVLIAEVLSSSTRGYDRGGKFSLYKELATLQEYVLVDSEQPHVEVYGRLPGSMFGLEMFDGLDVIITLAALGCELPLREVYSKVSWAATP
jgi:Uma2 family endonuclease